MANGYSTGGALVGAGIGAALGNPMLGAKVGTAAGSLLGSAVEGSKANQAAAPLEDPEQRQLLDEINRRRRSFETGSAFQSQRRALGQQQAALSRGIARASKGGTGATIAGLSRLQRTTGAALNEIFARGQQQQNFLDQMAVGLTNRMAQRRLDLQNLQQARAMARQNRMQREGTSGLLNILASNLPVKSQMMTSPNFQSQGQFSNSLSGILNK